MATIHFVDRYYPIFSNIATEWREENILIMIGFLVFLSREARADVIQILCSTLRKYGGIDILFRVLWLTRAIE